MKRNVLKVLKALLAFSLLLLGLTGAATAQESNPPGGLPATAGDSANPASPQAVLGSAFTYQGQLKNANGPVTDQCDMQFSLWDSDGNSTGQVGFTQTEVVGVRNGLFTVTDLDFGDAFTGEARWLQVAVRCPTGSGSYTTLSPRQELTAVPYALSLRPGAQIQQFDTSVTLAKAICSLRGCTTTGIDAVGGAYGVSALGSTGTGVWGIGANVGVKGTATITNGYGIYAEATGANGTGVYGIGTYQGTVGVATATSGQAYGVIGQANGGSPGYGVYGVGSAVGVYGRTSTGRGVVGSSTGGAGVHGSSPTTGTVGVATATSGQTYGVYGQADSADGSGVYGYNPVGRGVYGGSTSGYGVYGHSGSSYGVTGHSSSGTGVYGTSNSGVGVHAESSGDSGYGVYALATGTNGAGVYGSSPFKGIVGVATSTTGIPYGVQGQAVEGNGGTGVFGGGSHTGVYGYSTTDGNGVLGQTRNGGTAVRAEVGGSGGYGVYASAHGGIGIYATGGPTGTAGVFDGRVGIGTYDPTALLDVAGTAAANIVQIRGGSDLAEQFNVTSADQEIVPGLVVCLDPDRPGDLIVCHAAYDRTVAGVISGAGGMQPGVTLEQEGVMDGATSVAIAGRVYVKADASSTRIKPGDLLTSSSIPGCAMKATDREHAQGAIIGKAMSALENGQGLVLVLISLQ